jgi:hypothetical protein
VKEKVTGEGTTEYVASQMGDGERVIFYLLGQALLARIGLVRLRDILGDDYQVVDVLKRLKCGRA